MSKYGYADEKHDQEVGKRNPFLNRPVKGKTARKRRLPPQGKATNVGDPNRGASSGNKGKK